MRTFPLTEIPDFSDSDRIIVVGIVGKSPYNRRIKAKPLNCEFDSKKCEIQCSWSESQKVLYLHLSSWFDTTNLIDFVDGLGERDDERREGSEGVRAARRAGDFLVAAGDMASEVAEDLSLIFHLCHLIILSSPTAVFDLSYINLFKSVDALRAEIRPRIAELIRPLVGPDWAGRGRPCCPRVLFYFDSCPRQLRDAETSRTKVFEHNLEDQIYNVLRKTRIITNISAKSLMAIPKNEEFVYVNCGDGSPGGDLGSMVRSLVAACESPRDAPEWHRGETGRDTLRQFVQTHLDSAFASGFDDNVGKFAAFSPFEVPSAATWSGVAGALTDFFFASKTESVLAPLWDALSVDTRFSQGRCAKVLPLAQAAYTENLPSHYSTQHHQQRVAVAISVFSSVARGPLADWYRGQLEENCNQIWENRRLCEKPSLTGNPCIKPKHGSESEELHSSGVRYIAACNCGRMKGSRDDPYTVRIANFEFYANLGKECQCGTTSETINFPVFQPSINDFRAASVKSGPAVPVTTPNSDGNSPTELSQSSQEEPLSNVAFSDANVERSPNNELSSGERFTLLALSDAQFKDKGLVRQPSTTEYLPGMLHTESPPGLLPTFSSWSLVCLGFSSLYSHNIGLPEHLHPGFLAHLNFLVPWDCPVSRLDHQSWRNAGSQRGGMRGKPFASLMTVKIFLGMEYECPRGHRFMMSYVDEIVTGNVFKKDAGAKLASSDMPLYYHCPCRGSKQMVAQLMRVHIVSPKAPVNITLHPKVQPTVGGPAFVPGGERAPTLTPAAYWVLRLPYVYATERGPLPRPSAPLQPSARGSLLQGIVRVTH